MANVCEASKQGQVSGEGNLLHSSCDELKDRIEVLEERMCGILGLDDSAKTASPEPPEEQLVPLADSIRGARKSVVRSMARINSIIRRIEL